MLDTNSLGTQATENARKENAEKGIMKEMRRDGKCETGRCGIFSVSRSTVNEHIYFCYFCTLSYINMYNTFISTTQILYEKALLFRTKKNHYTNSILNTRQFM